VKIETIDGLIEVKFNNTIANDPCGICNSRCDPTGIDPFIAGTWSLVCDDCARQHGARDELDRARAADDAGSA